MSQLAQTKQQPSAYEMNHEILPNMNLKEYATLGELIASLNLEDSTRYMFIGKMRDGQRGFPLEEGSSLNRITQITSVSLHIGG
jgi:hypothetical protein